MAGSVGGVGALSAGLRTIGISPACGHFCVLLYGAVLCSMYSMPSWPQRFTTRGPVLFPDVSARGVVAFIGPAMYFTCLLSLRSNTWLARFLPASTSAAAEWCLPVSSSTHALDCLDELGFCCKVQTHAPWFFVRLLYVFTSFVDCPAALLQLPPYLWGLQSPCSLVRADCFSCCLTPVDRTPYCRGLSDIWRLCLDAWKSGVSGFGHPQ